MDYMGIYGRENGLYGIIHFSDYLEPNYYESNITGFGTPGVFEGFGGFGGFGGFRGFRAFCAFGRFGGVNTPPKSDLVGEMDYA